MSSQIKKFDPVKLNMVEAVTLGTVLKGIVKEITRCKSAPDYTVVFINHEKKEADCVYDWEGVRGARVISWETIERVILKLTERFADQLNNAYLKDMTIFYSRIGNKELKFQWTEKNGDKKEKSILF